MHSVNVTNDGILLVLAVLLTKHSRSRQSTVTKYLCRLQSSEV